MTSLKKTASLGACLALLLITTNLYATHTNPLTAQNLTPALNDIDPHHALKMQATPEVLAEINHMRTNPKIRLYMHTALERMNNNKNFLTAQLKNTDIPYNMLALPIVKSGYQPLDEDKNRMDAAGIWQITPSTAKYLGLTVNAMHDDRLDTQLSTAAALTYLNEMYKKFEDWSLAVVAYEYGENETRRLIRTVGTRDAWTIARAPAAPKYMKKYLAMFDASVIIMNKPALLSANG